VAALGDNEGHIKLIDPGSHVSLGGLPGHTGTVNSLAFSWDTKYLAAGKSGPAVDVWDVQSRQRILNFSKSDETTCWSVAFSRDAQLLAAGFQGGSAEVWNLADRHRVAVLAGPEKHFEAVGDLVFSPDGNTVFTASLDATIKRWNAHSGKLEATFGGQLLAYVALTISPDAQRIVSAGADGQVKLWDAANGHELATLTTAKTLGTLAFEPDGNTLVLVSPSEISVCRAPTLVEIDEFEAAALKRNK
jgi:WD40 repeat protein